MTYGSSQRKVAVITGAGSNHGIGRAVALCLANGGFDIAVTDIPGCVGLEDVAEELRATGVEVLALNCDNTSTEAVSSTVSHIVNEFGRIDVMVNNAGVSGAATKFADISDRDWDLAYEVNIRGTAVFCRAVLPYMVEQKSGIIINNASLCGLGAIDAIPASYTATKFAVVGLTKAIALEYAGMGIRCNVVCPGVVNTAMRKNAVNRIANKHGISYTEAEQLEDESIAMQRAAEPDEIAAVVAWLASPASSYITGVALPVAGGMAPGL